MEKKVQQKPVSSGKIPQQIIIDPFVKKARAAIRKKPLWREVDRAVLIATAKAVRKVMKDHGFDLAPPQASLMARFWVFDINVLWELPEAQKSVSAVMES